MAGFKSYEAVAIGIQAKINITGTMGLPAFKGCVLFSA
jgi:hypothetical protein